MVVEPLLLNSNEYALLLLEELGSSNIRNPKHLAIIQNAAIYYQCLVTKRQAGTMDKAQRDDHARNSYKSFTAPSFLCWWKTKCGLEPPTWLTMDMMGMTTQTDKEKKFFTKRGNLWGKYTGCGREIRRDLNNIWDSFMVNDELPSGQQAEDMWKYLQDQLWFIDRKEAQRKKDMIAANEARKASPVVIDEGKSDKTDPRTDSAVASKWLSGKERAEPDADEDGATTATTGKGKDRRKDISPDSAPLEEEESSASVKNESIEGGMVGDKGDEGDDEEKYGARPDGWNHPASLVFTLFGRPAGKDEDIDLQMKMTSGVSSGRKRQAQGGAPSTSEDPCASDEDGSQSSKSPGDRKGGLSIRSLQLMPGAGGKLSRANLKKARHAEKLDKKNEEEGSRDSELKRKALENLAAPRKESQASRDIANSMAVLTKSVEDTTRRADRRAQWRHNVEAKEAQLKLLERRGKGDSPTALKLEAELNMMYENPDVLVSDGVSQRLPVDDVRSTTESIGNESRTGGHGGDTREGGISVGETSVPGGIEVLSADDSCGAPGDVQNAVGENFEMRV